MEDYVLKGHSKMVWDLKFFPASRERTLMISSGWDHKVNIWDVNDTSRPPIHTFGGFNDFVRRICFPSTRDQQITGQETRFFVTSKDRTLRLFDLEKLVPLEIYEHGALSELEFVKERSLLAATVKTTTEKNMYGDIVLVDTRSPDRVVMTLKPDIGSNRDFIRCLLSLGENSLVSGGNSKSVRNFLYFWDLRNTGRMVKSIENKMRVPTGDCAIRGMVRMFDRRGNLGFACVTKSSVVIKYDGKTHEKLWECRVGRGCTNDLDFVSNEEIETCFGDRFARERVEFMFRVLFDDQVFEVVEMNVGTSLVVKIPLVFMSFC